MVEVDKPLARSEKLFVADEARAVERRLVELAALMPRLSGIGADALNDAEIIKRMMSMTPTLGKDGYLVMLGFVDGIKTKWGIERE